VAPRLVVWAPQNTKIGWLSQPAPALSLARSSHISERAKSQQHDWKNISITGLEGTPQTSRILRPASVAQRLVFRTPPAHQIERFQSAALLGHFRL